MTVCQLIKQIISCTILLFVFFTSYVVASSFEDIEGNGCYKYGDNETPLIAKEMALNIAKRKAIESYKVYVSSTTDIEDFKLKRDIITSLAGAYLYELKIIRQKEENRKVCVWIKAKIKPDEVDNLIANKLSSKSGITKSYLYSRENIWRALTLSKDDLPADFVFLQESPGKKPGIWGLLENNPGFINLTTMKEQAQKEIARDPSLDNHPIFKTVRWYVALFSKPQSTDYMFYSVNEYNTEADAIRFLKMGHIAEDGKEGCLGSFRYKNYVVLFAAQDASHTGIRGRNLTELKMWSDRMLELVQAKLHDISKE